MCIRDRKENFPPGSDINYELLFKEAGIKVEAGALTEVMKGKVRNWRNGIKPSAAMRAEKIECLFRQIYPEAFD